MAGARSLIIFGASGHAKVVIRCAEETKRFRVVGLLDDDPAKANGGLLGYRVVGGRDRISGLLGEFGRVGGVVAIGINPIRATVAEWLISAGVELVSIVHPSAVVSPCVSIGGGTLVMPGVVITAESVIGVNAIVNSNATVEHDCVLGDGCHVGPGATLCGGVRVGGGALVGAGATVLPGISIGRRSVVAAGAVVLEDVPDDCVVAGVPAIRKRGPAYV